MARTPIDPARLKEIQRVDGKTHLMPSEQEMHERRVFVRSLHALGMRSQEICDRALLPGEDKDGNPTPPRFLCKEDAIRRIISEIRAELAREIEVFQPTARAAGLERLYQHLLRANSDLQQMRALAKKDWRTIQSQMAEILKLENQIAKMEGTLEPIKVEHSGELNLDLQRAIVSMTPEQLAQAVAEEQVRLLNAGSITTTAEDVQAPAPAQPRRRQTLPAPSPSSLLDRSGQAPVANDPSRGRPAPARERSSDLAARREVRSPMDTDVEARPGPRGISARVVS